jgi:mannose-6-phosphate isomerase-like protein (cupin superfamily)
MGNKLPQKIDKPWGYELLWAHTPRYAGKIFFVKKGHRLSLHYHEKKDETHYVYEGKTLMEMEDSNGKLTRFEASAGDCYRILPYTKHRLKAIEDTVIFEVSTPELEDISRFEDDYGRA